MKDTKEIKKIFRVLSTDINIALQVRDRVYMSCSDNGEEGVLSVGHNNGRIKK